MREDVILRYWAPQGSSRGHVSLEFRGIYLSFVPLDANPRRVTRLDNLKNDIAKMGGAPDHSVRIKNLNVTRMSEVADKLQQQSGSYALTASCSWSNFWGAGCYGEQKENDYYKESSNCTSFVYKILEAGGIDHPDCCFCRCNINFARFINGTLMFLACALIFGGKFGNNQDAMNAGEVFGGLLLFTWAYFFTVAFVRSLCLRIGLIATPTGLFNLAKRVGYLESPQIVADDGAPAAPLYQAQDTVVLMP